MANDMKVTLSLHRDVLSLVEEEGRKRGLSRSAMVEEALRTWFRMDEYARLARGYAEMAEENLGEAEWWLPLAVEALNADERGEKGRGVARHARRRRK
jgi:hypothetical protein